MVTYHVSFQNPLSHFLHISLKLEGLSASTLYLQLPAWRPGRYELQHFAQKIQRFQVLEVEHQPVPFQKITKDRWEIRCEGLQEVEVRYTFYAYQMDAGGSWLDETQLYLNPINCLVAVEGREQEPCELSLALPQDWQIACGLPEPRAHVLLAQNYDQLVDSPLIASPSLQEVTYEVQGLPFHIWIQGDCSPDWQQIRKDFTAFTQEQLELFGEFPAADYHYLNQVLPYKHYHGVEHANSTVVTLGPAELLMTPALYKEFLGINSHELFHAWNIKKIRPAEMMPYDYTRENYFRTGFVAEGLTTYYGDYLLARSGVFTTEQYFNELNGVLSKYYDDNGRFNLSVADSSFDLWLDGYKPGIPDRKVSIYHKGALAALLLDLNIRKETNNMRSLDDVIRLLWEDFGKPGIGFTEQDYEAVVARVLGEPFRSYFEAVIYGTAPLEDLLQEAFDYVGCRLVTEESVAPSESLYGFKTLLREQTTVVTATVPGSPAWHHLSVDDEIVAVNGRKVEANFQILLGEQQKPVTLSVFRQKQLRTLSLPVPTAERYLQKYTVAKKENASYRKQENFRLWLKQDF
ncbi:PDZ domain-containing protein [soil metagenome]